MPQRRELPLTTVFTKLRPPGQRRKLLRRERLSADIETNVQRRLVLVSAPAGYGKTSVLAQLFGELSRQGRHVCWISLDEHDNDVVRFVAHLRESIRQAGVPLSHEAISLLDAGASQGEAPSASALRTALLNEFAVLKADLFLFFDDFHVLQAAGILDLVSALLLAPIDRLHLVISSRGQPALPIARLRGLGEIKEIDARMLAFSSQEAIEFMQMTGGCQLNNSQIGQLWDKTEGWIASLQMAAIAIQSSSNADVFLSQFSGADRSIADFLVEEVLHRQTEEIQRFLLATSILDRFNCELCNAVLECRDGRSLIDEVEQLNLFIFSLDRDRTWYRYHRLFSDLLRKRLVDRFPDEAASYHRRACRWLAANGQKADAIDHAFSAGDLDQAGALIDAVSASLFASGQTAMLRSLADRLPAGIVKTLPQLQLELAWENTTRWRFDEARQALTEVRKILADQERRSKSCSEEHLLDAETALSRMKLAHRQFMLGLFADDIEHSLVAGKSWIAEFGDRDKFMRSSVDIALIMCNRETYRCELTQTRAEELRKQLIEANAIYGTVFLDTVVGSTHFARGDLQLAEHAFSQARIGAIRIHGEHSALATMPSAQLAQLLYERNNLDEARQLIDEFNELPPEFRLVDSVIARYVTEARLARHAGMTVEAHYILDLATSIADRYRLPRLHAHVFAERVPLLISDGLSRDAERLTRDPRYQVAADAASLSGHVDTTKECFVMATTRLAFERGEENDAIKVLRRWLSWTRDRQCLRSSVRLAVLLACLCYRNGDGLTARRVMIEALHWGEKGGFIRSFVDEGATVAEILEALAGLSTHAEGFSDAYLKRLLMACGRQPGNEAITQTTQVPQGGEDARSLSEREIDILRLTAANLVTREIAAALGLAESTVKWYWKRIFEKLGVHRRSLAVRAARLRGLIT